MSVTPRKRLIVVVGPTAVGKTHLSIQLAKRFETEIISADSRQIFRELTIGTAKPSQAELAAVRHHFIDHHSIHDPYDSGRYGEEALELIESLFQRLDQLILCGGSGLYIKSVLEGFDEMPDIPKGIREQVIKDYQHEGLAWLQSQVAKSDPDYYSEMDTKNPQRLMRALEIIQATGKQASALRKSKKRALPFDVVKIGLELDREDLYEAIDERVDHMMAGGLLEEARQLYLYKSKNALQTVGYQELFDFIDGKYDLEEAIRLVKRNTRRYAKRQLTWFKKDAEIKWFEPNRLDQVIEYLNGK
ncbi:MAG TPA: tRNA (adenosine(37)-N6)-dimethylallyltransferase MiaA [Cyclobacteriaceae bacterium]